MCARVERSLYFVDNGALSHDYVYFSLFITLRNLNNASLYSSTLLLWIIYMCVCVFSLVVAILFACFSLIFIILSFPPP